MSQTTIPTYILGTSDVEIEHLVRQAEVYAPAERELLDEIDIQPGWRAIDVACGALGNVQLVQGDAICDRASSEIHGPCPRTDAARQSSGSGRRSRRDSRARAPGGIVVAQEPDS